MAENSKIEWTDHTFNGWVGCTKISPACDFCYAETWSKRAGRPQLWNGERSRTSEANWKKPIKWNAAALAAGRRARVFCCSLADVFDNQADPQWRFDLFALIRATPSLEWQLLTKRPQNIIKMSEAAAGLPWNAAIGTTIENQLQATIRGPQLLSAASALNPLYTFFSCEPLLGSLDLWLWLDPQRQFRRHVDWVICGGESGAKPRAMEQAWAESLKQQCEAAGVAFFMKQMTGKKPIPEHLMVRQFPSIKPPARRAAGE